MTRARNTRRIRSVIALISVASCVFAVGCNGPEHAEGPPIDRSSEPAPAYSAVAAKHNERVARLDRLWARAVVRIKYFDEKGDEHNEQGEGLLQVARPDRMGLSIKKAGKMLFWFGGDAQRYWLFDVVNAPVVRVGRHELIGKRAGEAGLGIDINPRDMIALLGITPLPASTQARAGVQAAWSRNGHYIEATVPLPSGAKQVFSMEPLTLYPRKIAFIDASGKPIVTAVLENYEDGPVNIAGYGGQRPRVASRVTATHHASKTEIKLDLSEMRNDGVTDKAFDFDTLKESLGVDRVIDVDATPAPAR